MARVALAGVTACQASLITPQGGLSLSLAQLMGIRGFATCAARCPQSRPSCPLLPLYFHIFIHPLYSAETSCHGLAQRAPPSVPAPQEILEQRRKANPRERMPPPVRSPDPVDEESAEESGASDVEDLTFG